MANKYKAEVCFLGLDDSIQIDFNEQFTLRDLKILLQEKTIVPISDQKILHKNAILNPPDSTPLRQLTQRALPLQLALLLQTPKTKTAYQQERQAYLWQNKKQANLRQRCLAHLLQQRNSPAQQIVRKFQLINAFLTKDCLDALARRIFSKADWKGREEELLRDKQLLTFVLKKIANQLSPGNQYTQQLFSRLSSRVAKAIVGNYQPIIESDHEPAPTYDRKALQQIKTMNFPEPLIIEALHRYRNQYYEALKWLASQNRPGLDPPCEVCDENDEEMFIYSWLGRRQHTLLKLRLALSPQQIQIYLNSLKIRAPPLYNIFRRHRKYTWLVLCRLTASEVAAPDRQL